MTVVSSIAAGDLDPERLRARGALMLREFLAYAAGAGLPGVTAVPGAPTTEGHDVPEPAPRSVVLGDLARRLRAEGLVVREGLGSSADPVDLDVEDPNRPGRLLLAIESDGPEYAAMRTVRDRDRLSQAMNGVDYVIHAAALLSGLPVAAGAGGAPG